MPNFTTRVELVDATPADNEAMSAEMKKAGFTDSVNGSDGKSYRLPSGEFSYIGDSTAQEVREKAKAVAAGTSKAFFILVTEAVTRTWYLPSLT